MSLASVDAEPSPPSTALHPSDEVRRDRERIALEVNDVVIRHLFALGLDLHTTRTLVDEAVRGRIDATIAELDAAISELRRVVFVTAATT